MEEKLDKLIALMESQNKAWDKTLQLLNNINIVLVEKYKAAELLLEKHPAVRNQVNREPTQPINNNPTQPYNPYSDSLPYGTDIEEEKERMDAGISYPPNQGNYDAPPQDPQMNVQEQSLELPPDAPQSEPTDYTGGETVERLDEQTTPPKPLPPVTSKAEMLQRQVTLPKS